MHSVKIELNNSGLKKNLEAIIRSVEGFRVQRDEDTRRPDLLIFESGDDAENTFELIRSLLNADAVGEVFLTSENADPAVLMEAMRTGVKEFLSQPLKEEEAKQALERFRERKERSKYKDGARHGRIIDVMGSKGGIGTTTVAVNLAVSLAQLNENPSVALVDMNMLFGDIPLFLGFKPNYNWGEIIKNIGRLDPTFLMSILSKHSSGVHVLPSPAYLNGYPAATPETIGHLIGLMQRMFDFVVIDGGQSINESSLKAVEMSDNLLLISLLSLTCMSNAGKLLKSLNSLGHLPKENIRVVINRYLKNSDISLSDAENAVKQKIFWAIPNDYKTTMSAINQGKTLSEITAKSPVASNFRDMARSLAHEEEKREKKRWGFLKRA